MGVRSLRPSHRAGPAAALPRLSGAGKADRRRRNHPRSHRNGGRVMCNSCGCGDHELVPVDVHERILAGNDKTAAHNRAHFGAAGVVAINLMGAPGAGKTAVLEATARALAGCRIVALAGDLATDNDAVRLRAAGITATAITTGSACHLDAQMVHKALHDAPWRTADYLFIENVEIGRASCR